MLCSKQFLDTRSRLFQNRLHKSTFIFSEFCQSVSTFTFTDLKSAENISVKYLYIVFWANLCVPRLLEVKGKGISGVGEVADKETYTVNTINIISPRQYFVARCLSSYIGNVFGLHSICVCFPSTRKLMT
jgi:hypothetical protein